jgi:hypothetical protein
MTTYLTDRALASPSEFVSEVRSIARGARRQLSKPIIVSDLEKASLTAVADELERIAGAVEREPATFHTAIADVTTAIDRWRNRNDPTAL